VCLQAPWRCGYWPYSHRHCKPTVDHEGLFSFTLWTKSNSCQVAFHQLEFPVVSISKWSLMSYNSFFMWNQISVCFIFTWPEKLYPLLSAIYLILVSYLMEPTGTGHTCPVDSTLSWSAEFKHRTGAQKYIGKYCTCLRRSAYQRQLRKGGRAVMTATAVWVNRHTLTVPSLCSCPSMYIICHGRLDCVSAHPDSKTLFRGSMVKVKSRHILVAELVNYHRIKTNLT
jgi:hypothetical protein